MKPKISRYSSLFLMTSGHMMTHIYTLVIPPLLPIFTLIYGLTYSQGGFLVAVLNVGMMMQLLVGYYSDRSGRRSILAGLGLTFTALLTVVLALTGNYISLLVTAFALGVIASTFHPPGTTLVTEYFTNDKRGKALGIHLIGGSIGNSLGPILIGVLIAFTAWQNSLFIIATPGIIIGILYWQFVKDIPTTTSTAHQPTNTNTDQRKKIPPVKVRSVKLSFAIIIIAEMLGLTAFYGMVSFLPLYLVSEFNASVTFAALLLGLMPLAGVAGGPLGGWLSDRFGRKPMIVLGLALQPLLIYLLLLAPIGVIMYLIIILEGFIVYVLTVSVAAYVADLVPPSLRATAYAAYFTFAFAWMAIIPLFTGNQADIVGFKNAFTILILISVSGAILSLFIKKLG